LPAIYLRAYTEADLPALYLLDQACFPPGIAYSQTELADFLRHPSTFAAIAVSEGELAGKLVGFAVVRPVRRKAAFGRMIPALHVLTIDVDPGVRRQGIGAVLMDWIGERARALGSRRIVLEVAANNHAAQHFYGHNGFKRTGMIPGYYNGTTDAYTLERSCP
jgi:ribosomal-protein-alanine N-acetyltransferase